MKSLSVLAVLFASLVAAAGCTAPVPLTDYCMTDPLVADCPRGSPCASAYPCLAYCLRHYPDGTGVPATGMGEWCDHPTLPGDYGALCAANAGVDGCEAYCAERPGLCGAPADGDADADADAPCSGDEECTDPGASRCREGRCAPCEEPGDCEHLAATPACNEGTCVECVDPSTCDDGTGCSIASCESFACVFDLDVDDDGAECVDDCDDEDPDRFPESRELCDGVDNDCDGEPEADFDWVVTRSLVSEVGAAPESVAVAWSGAVHAVAWCDSSASGSAPVVALVDPAGAVVGRLAPLPDSDVGCIAIDLAWTGTDFVAVWVGEEYRVLVQAFPPTGGTVLEGMLVDALVGARGLSIAHSGSDRLAVVLRRDDATRTRLYNDAFAPVGSPIPRGADTVLDADVAAGPEGFLVVWTGTSGTESHLRAEVVPFDATVPDAVNLEVGAHELVMFSASAAWVGDGWVAAWTRLSGGVPSVRTVHLDPSGIPDATATTIFDPDAIGFAFFNLSLAPADGRGGPPGLGLVLIGGDELGAISAQATRLDPTGAALEGLLHLGNVADVGADAMAMVDVSASADGMAAVYADHGSGTAGSVWFSTFETCF